LIAVRSVVRAVRERNELPVETSVVIHGEKAGI
jgi:hypothetical protein